MSGVDFAQRWKLAQGPDATREVLRDAAHEMIRTEGLPALNMRGLAAKVGVSAMAPYKYYTCKDTLVEDLRDRVLSEFAACLQAAADAESDPIERLRQLCSAYLGYALRNEQDYRLMFAAGRPARSSTASASSRAQAWQVLLDALDNIPFPPCEPDVVEQAHLVWATLHGLVMLHLSKRLTLGRSIEGLGDPAARYVLNALRLA